MSYGTSNGKFQKSYEYFYKKLVPLSGKSENPEGELLRWVSKYYYRRDNDGDSYYDCQKMWGYPKISDFKFKNIEKTTLDLIDRYLSSYRYDDAVDKVMKYIMLKISYQN